MARRPCSPPELVPYHYAACCFSIYFVLFEIPQHMYKTATLITTLLLVCQDVPERSGCVHSRNVQPPNVQPPNERDRHAYLRFACLLSMP